MEGESKSKSLKGIIVMLIITIIDGIFVGYCNYEGKDDLIFYPLIIGFVLVFILYHLIERYGDIRIGNDWKEE